MQSRATRLDELGNDEVMTNEKTSRNRELFFSSFGHFGFLRRSLVLPHVYLSTSSTVVSPAKMLRKPSWRSVIIPSSTAFCFNVTVGARSLINSRIGSAILSSSYIPFRPLYPVLLQASQPFL